MCLKIEFPIELTHGNRFRIQDVRVHGLKGVSSRRWLSFKCSHRILQDLVTLQQNRANVYNASVTVGRSLKQDENIFRNSVSVATPKLSPDFSASRPGNCDDDVTRTLKGFRPLSKKYTMQPYSEINHNNSFYNANLTYLDLEYSFEQEQEVCASFNEYLNYFHIYYIPFIISVGLIGNLLSSIVFLTTHLRMRSSSYYLAALAVADFGFLSVLLIVHFSFNGVVEIYNRPGWCQTFVYVSTVCSTLSVWLIVAFTVERFIAVQYPLQRPHICTVARAKIIVTVLSLVALTSQAYIFWIAGIINVHGVDECEMIPDYHDFMKIINFIDTIVTLIGPVILIVTMNTMIARNLLQFRKRFQNGSLDECLCSGQDGTELQRSHTQVSLDLFSKKEKRLICCQNWFLVFRWGAELKLRGWRS